MYYAYYRMPIIMPIIGCLLLCDYGIMLMPIIMPILCLLL